MPIKGFANLSLGKLAAQVTGLPNRVAKTSRGRLGRTFIRYLYLLLLAVIALSIALPGLTASARQMEPEQSVAGSPLLIAPPSQRVSGAVAAAASPSPSPSPVPSYFSAAVKSTPRDNAAPYLQDVTGTVVDKTGKGADGAVVRVWSAGWQAFDTAQGGNFKFVLTPGQYQAQLQGLRSDEARFVVDTKAEVRIEFKEVAAAAVLPAATTVARTPTTPATAVPSPTSTSTPTPSSTPTPTSTATPNASPLPAIGTPVSIGGGIDSKPTRTPTPIAVLPFIGIPTLDVTVEDFRYSITWGALLALSGACLVLIVAIIRR